MIKDKQQIEKEIENLKDLIEHYETSKRAMVKMKVEHIIWNSIIVIAIIFLNVIFHGYLSIIDISLFILLILIGTNKVKEINKKKKEYEGVITNLKTNKAFYNDMLKYI